MTEICFPTTTNGLLLILDLSSASLHTSIGYCGAGLSIFFWASLSFNCAYSKYLPSYRVLSLNYGNWRGQWRPSTIIYFISRAGNLCVPNKNSFSMSISVVIYSLFYLGYTQRSGYEEFK